MSDGDALLKAVVENPADDAPRLVYADWLDEHGDADRAAFIRVQCELGEWARFYDPNPTPERPRQGRLFHRDGRVRNPSDPDWLRLLQTERELAERNWLTWVRPFVDIFRSPRQLAMASQPWVGFVRRLIGRPDPDLDFAYNPDFAPVHSCAISPRLHPPRRVLDNHTPLRRLALTRGFAGVLELWSHVTADQMQKVLASQPVEFLSLQSPSAAAVAKRAGRRVPVRYLSLVDAEATALRAILLGNSDFSPQRLFINERTCTPDLAQLLADSPVVAEVEELYLVFSSFNDGLSPVEAETLTRNPHFRRLTWGRLTIMAGLQSSETIRILSERFGPAQRRSGFNYEFPLEPGFKHEFRLEPAESPQTRSVGPE